MYYLEKFSFPTIRINNITVAKQLGNIAKYIIRKLYY